MPTVEKFTKELDHVPTAAYGVYMTTTNSTLDNPRIRFAWGYQDAAAEVARGKRRNVAGHFDRAYRLGYEAAAAQGTDVDRSGSAVQAAWDRRRRQGDSPWRVRS